MITKASLTTGSDDNLKAMTSSNNFSNSGNKMATLARLVQNLTNQSILILNCIEHNNLSPQTMSYVHKNKGLQISTESMILIPHACNKELDKSDLQTNIPTRGTSEHHHLQTKAVK